MSATEEIEQTLKGAKTPLWKKLFIPLLLVAAVTGAWRFYYLTFAVAKPPSYVTQAPRKGDLDIFVSATGNLEPTNSVDIGIEVSGTIQEIYVDYNDRVKKGDLLAKLDTTKLRSQLNSSLAALEVAQAQAAQAQASMEQKHNEYTRLQRLFDTSGGVQPPQQELDSARFAYKIAQATYRSAQASVKQAQYSVDSNKEDLQKAVVRSSIDGIVLDKLTEVGQTVAATLQTPKLFTLARDLSKMELIISVDEADIGRIKEGMEVRFGVDAYMDKTFKGTVRQIRLNPVEVGGVITYDTVVSVKNEQLLLKPGMTATARIITQNFNDVWIVPNAALRYRPDAAAGTEDEERIWYLEGQTPKAKPVTVLGTDGMESAVKASGMEELAKIIIAQKIPDA